MHGRHKFDVFGKVMVAELSATGWQLFVMGIDGKRSPAGVIVPSVVAEDELCQYLDDIYHEMATPQRPAVIAIND
jgi:hypothetical protein